MNPRPLLIPMLAVLVVAAVPALAQYPMPKAAPPPTPSANPAPAQTPAAAVAPAQAPAAPTALPAVPAHNCIAPEYPGINASNTKVTAFNRDYKTYGDCIKKYVDENRAWVEAVVAANNKAVEEYNKLTERLKKEIDAQ